jgi:hypothetical protein
MAITSKIITTIDQFLDRLVPYYVYILALFHIYAIQPNYLTQLNIAIQVFICVFLVIRFNPFRTHYFKEGDALMIFGSATFLLLNLGFIEIVKPYMPMVIENKLEKLLNNKDSKDKKIE